MSEQAYYSSQQQQQRYAKGGASSTVPSDIAGLRVWLRPEGLAALADNDPIATWDNEGSFADATQGTAGFRPLCKTAVANGYRVARFDGADDWLVLPSHAALTAATVFIVVKLDVDPPAAGAQTGLWHFGGAAQTTNFPWTEGIVYDAFGTTAAKTTVNPTPSLASQFRIYEVVSAAGDWRSYLGGALLHSTATNTVVFPAAPSFGVSVGAYYLDGDIAELILYDTALSAPNRALVEAYLTTKFAL